MKFALIRMSALGDLIFSLAASRCLKSGFPDASITWFTDARFGDILDDAPDVDQVVKIPLKHLSRKPDAKLFFSEVGKIRRAGPFDLAVDLHGRLKSAIVGKIACRNLQGFNEVPEDFVGMFYTRSFSKRPGLTNVDQFFQGAAAAAGVDAGSAPFKPETPLLGYSPADAEAVCPLFAQGESNVVMIPCTSRLNKNFSTEKYAVIAGALGGRVIVTHGNDEEKGAAMQIAKLAPNAVVAPRLTLGQLKALVGLADLLVGGDTGPSHIAWAMRVPSVVLLGPARPNLYAETPLNRLIPIPAGSYPPEINSIDEHEVIAVARMLLQRHVAQ